MVPRKKRSEAARKKVGPVEESEKKSPPQKPRGPIIVGVGASAGGLEALDQFLSHVPEGSQMAIVIVQHLDPTHKGIMVELLQRSTAMKVVQVKNRMHVAPNCVYVIPPNKDMSILHGVLHLFEPMAPRGLRLPIDFFLRSLAEDQQERSIGVILSGMGSDGTLGLKAIKEKAGVVFVQSPASAKFDGMPRSAVDAGLADVVAPVDELPGKIIAYLRHAPLITGPESFSESKSQSALERVAILVRAKTGHDFSLYKKSTIYRRIERRMGLHQIGKIADYVRYLQENPAEVDLLFQELLIGVTCFFRDPAAWEQLKDEAIPGLLADRPSGQPLRAWVAGCSTGEEAYSLAMVFKEALERLKLGGAHALQIFATDLDRDAIDKARLGVFPVNITADVSPQRLKRFFIQEEHGYRVGREIREMVTFAAQNVIMDPPFTKLDILTCRNLLIYLAPEMQKKLLPLFHYSLNSGGLLFLGSAESIGACADLFDPVHGKMRLYRRIDSAMPAGLLEFPSALAPLLADSFGQSKSRQSVPSLQSLADQLILDRFAPAAVLVTTKGDILYISGRTGKYLEPAAGKANWNILAMAREGLRHELAAAFQKAIWKKGNVALKNIRVMMDDRREQTVDVLVQTLQEPETLRGMVLVVISDVAASSPAKQADSRKRRPSGIAQVAQLEQELQRSRAEVQTTREEMQTSQEELRSVNEELQSANEELQSSNEELTTSREEMQSLNEELQTVNHELQAKVDDLSRVSNDMKNLLDSTDIATLFLDDALRVRRFTAQATKIIRLIPSDVGRPVTDIAFQVAYPELAEDAHEVLRTLVSVRRKIAARDDRRFTARIMPYRTLDNRIDGVVITFVDITGSEAMEQKLRDEGTELRRLTEFLPLLIWTCGPEGDCDYLSRQWIEYTGVPAAEHLGKGWLRQVHADDRERVEAQWKAALAAGQPFDSQFRILGKDGAHRWFKSRAMPIWDEQGNLLKWCGTHTDIEDVKEDLKSTT